MRAALLLMLFCFGCTSAVAGPNNSFLDAFMAYSSGRYEDSIPLLRPWAENGHPVAQHLLGKALLSSFVKSHDCDGAKYWLKRSAQHGNAEAAFALGGVFESGECAVRNERLALRWYLQADSLKHGDAATDIGEIILSSCVQRDCVLEAQEWFLKGIANYDWHGAYDLANMFFAGKPSGRELEEGLKWLEVAYLQRPRFPADNGRVLKALNRVRELLTPREVETASRNANRIIEELIRPMMTPAMRLTAVQDEVKQVVRCKENGSGDVSVQFRKGS